VPPEDAPHPEIDIPPDWAAVVRELASAPWRRVVVVGARDRGKSTFCQLAVASLVRAHRRVGLIDSDLGQKMIGPPLCVTFATAGEDGRLALERLRFVGETNPAASMAGVVACVARLAQAAAVERLVVNTSGLVRGPGLALKRWKIDALAPDLIIALAEGDELEPVLRPLPPGRVVRLGPSANARRKSPARRETERARALGDAFRAAQLHRLVGVPQEELEAHPPAEAVVRLCGLADLDGEDLGLGLVRAGADQGAVPVLTSVEPARVRRLRLGMAAPIQLLAALPHAEL
jgi:polynucleotide 5'-hydroxyl-kinase GRC3/NOL9